MTPLDTQQHKICLSENANAKAESSVGRIKTFCHNGVANTLQNMLGSGGKIISTDHGESNLWESKSEGTLRDKLIISVRII